jgi:hypothetical protein
MKPQNFEERLIWYTIIGTYVLYVLGAQPIVVPLITWLLALYFCKKFWKQTPNTPVQERITVSFTVRLWIICIFTVLVGLIIAHINFDTGVDRFIKSLLKWAREFALWGLFPLIGCLNIRPQLLYRAACIVCLQSLILIPICYLAFILHLPEGTLYVSPLAYLGGNSPDLYSTVLYFFDSETNLPRLTFFAPWCPNLALIAMIYFFLARQESNKRWRLIGMIGSTAMVVTTVSRLAVLSLPMVILLTWVLTNFSQPIIYFATGIVSFLTSIFAAQLNSFFEIFAEKFNGARASSSEVRINLVRISLDRWWSDAPIWGHGFTEVKGPPVVYFLPIGTGGCGTWVNLLYTKGIVGFIAVAVPFVWSFVDVVIKAQKSTTARVGLSVLLVFFLFSFIEELDLLSYIYWPGILMIGIALKGEVQEVSNPIVINMKRITE